jgi:hypothetical protein
MTTTDTRKQRATELVWQTGTGGLGGLGMQERPFIWFALGTSDGRTAVTNTLLAETLAPRITRLRVAWGLNADQIASLFAVSRRAVQAWMAGGALRPRHVERLNVIERRLPEPVPDVKTNRKMILAGSGVQPSIYAQLLLDVHAPVRTRAVDLLHGVVEASPSRGRLLDGPEWQLPS